MRLESWECAHLKVSNFNSARYKQLCVIRRGFKRIRGNASQRVSFFSFSFLLKKHIGDESLSSLPSNFNFTCAYRPKPSVLSHFSSRLKCRTFPFSFYSSFSITLPFFLCCLPMLISIFRMKGVCCELHFLGFVYLLILTISSSMDDDERFLFGVIIVFVCSTVVQWWQNQL